MLINGIGLNHSIFYQLFFYCIYLLQLRSRALINDLFEVDQEKVTAVQQEIADGTIFNAIVQEAKVTTSREERVEKYGFFSFIYECFQKRRDQLGNVKFFKAAEKFIDERMDVMSILYLYEKVERLGELTLSEEDRQIFEVNRKRASLFK